MSSRALLPLLLALCLPTGCGSERVRPDAPDVLMVIVDTLRADKLGCYGNARGLTPGLDTLAAESVVFEQASSHAPWTLPSTASLLTSQLPRQHGAGGVVPRFTHLAEGVTTLPAHFAARGYATASIVNVAFLGHDFGLAAGFEHVDAEYYETNVEVRRALETTDAALAWLRGRDARPFFLLVHYFDPHAVYDPPQPFRRRFAEERDREDESFVFGTREHMVGLRSGRLDLRPEILRRAEALYDGEVAYTDAEVSRLLRGLEDMDLGDAIVVVTSDHGEEFGEHGGFEHGHTLYAELCHVPLLLRAPGLGPARVPQGVGHVDLAPTLCELAGLPVPGGWAGRSLLPLLEQPEAGDRDVLAHGNFWGPPLTSWRQGREKLIVTPERPPELYYWREDPGEQHDVAPREGQRVGALRGRMAEVEAELGARRGALVDLNAARQRELESLGYGPGRDD